jgi:hypothetical protein
VNDRDLETLTPEVAARREEKRRRKEAKRREKERERRHRTNKRPIGRGGRDE